MRGDIVTLGSACGIHGCQRVTVTHKGGGDMSAKAVLSNNNELGVDVSIVDNGISVAADALNPHVGVVVSPKDNNGIQTAISLVCRTSQGQWEYLMVREGEIMLIDGQRVMVKRRTS